MWSFCEWRRYRGGRAVVVMLAAALLMSGLSPAAAAPAPIPGPMPTAPRAPVWQRDLDEVRGLLPLPNGDVLTGAPTNSPAFDTDAFPPVALGPDGAVTWVAPYFTPDTYDKPITTSMLDVTAAVTVAPNRLYLGRSTGYFDGLEGYEAGRQIWAHDLPLGSMLFGLAAGPGPTLYALIGSCFDDNRQAIMAVDSATGVQAPLVTLPPHGCNEFRQLYATSTGLVLVGNTGYAFVGYDGTIRGSAAQASTAFAGTAIVPTRTAASDGALYAVVDGSSGFTCDARRSSQVSVQRLTGEGLRWKRALTGFNEGCSQGFPMALQPYPGGVVAVWGSAGGRTARLVGYGTGGDILWTDSLAFGKRISRLDVVVDSAGNVALAAELDHFCGPESDPCTDIMLGFRPVGGRAAVLEVRGPSLSNAATAGLANGWPSIALTPGRLLVATLNLANAAQRTHVQAFALPAATAAYPASAEWELATPDAGQTFVVLGDSFSSGEGSTDNYVSAGSYPYLPETDTVDNHCHRSEAAYGVRAWARLPAARPRLVFAACSGAVIADFFQPHDNVHRGDRTGEPAQLDALDPETRVVTLTIGGNDIGFGDVIAACSSPSLAASSCSDAYDDRVDQAIDVLGGSARKGKQTNATTATGNYAALFAAITQRAPQAEVYVLGYPRFFEAGVYERECPAVGVLSRLSAADMIWINGEIASLNHEIERAARKAGIHYVDTYDTFQGHERCTFEPWINGVRFYRTVLADDRTKSSYQAGSFHPNPAGHVALAEVLTAAMAVHG